MFDPNSIGGGSGGGTAVTAGGLLPGPPEILPSYKHTQQNESFQVRDGM